MRNALLSLVLIALATSTQAATPMTAMLENGFTFRIPENSELWLRKTEKRCGLSVIGYQLTQPQYRKITTFTIQLNEDQHVQVGGGETLLTSSTIDVWCQGGILFVRSTLLPH